MRTILNPYILKVFFIFFGKELALKLSQNNKVTKISWNKKENKNENKLLENIMEFSKKNKKYFKILRMVIIKLKFFIFFGKELLALKLSQNNKVTKISWNKNKN